MKFGVITCHGTEFGPETPVTTPPCGWQGASSEQWRYFIDVQGRPFASEADYRASAEAQFRSDVGS